MGLRQVAMYIISALMGSSILLFLTWFCSWSCENCNGDWRARQKRY